VLIADEGIRIWVDISEPRDQSCSQFRGWQKVADGREFFSGETVGSSDRTENELRSVFDMKYGIYHLLLDSIWR